MNFLCIWNKKRAEALVILSLSLSQGGALI